MSRSAGLAAKQEEQIQAITAEVRVAGVAVLQYGAPLEQVIAAIQPAGRSGQIGDALLVGVAAGPLAHDGVESVLVVVEDSEAADFQVVACQAHQQVGAESADEKVVTQIAREDVRPSPPKSTSWPAPPSSTSTPSPPTKTLSAPLPMRTSARAYR